MSKPTGTGAARREANEACLFEPEVLLLTPTTFEAESPFRHKPPELVEPIFRRRSNASLF
jgi:hypothetical protein